MADNGEFKYDVFISYARDDAEHHVTNAFELNQWLEKQGYKVWFDLGLKSGQQWDEVLKEKVKSAKRIIVLWSPRAAVSDYVQLEVIAGVLDDKVVPLIIEEHPIPDYLKKYHHVNVDNLYAQKQAIVEALGIEPSGDLEKTIPPSDPNRIDIFDLPNPGGRLIGRDVELTRLNTAWASTAPGADRAQKTNIFVLHAIGGAGKTALMREFIDELNGNAFEGAYKVLGWSAYSQGSGNARNADADGFIEKALLFFGHNLTTHPIKDATERGRKLAALIGAKRCLLVLDGLEPLQEVESINGGRLKDRGMEALIKCLAVTNKGLVLITSRQELPELKKIPSPTIINHELNQLDNDSGVKLLEHLGVHGKPEDLESAVESVLGHALSINLLGTYLDHVHGGDVNQRQQFGLDKIQDETSDFIGDKTARYAKRAARIMEGYTNRFEELKSESGSDLAIENAILHMVGLFDRPMTGEIVDVLLQEPLIEGLTDVFEGMAGTRLEGRWQTAIKRLRKLKLLSKEDAKNPRNLDAHPIIRAHFGRKLKTEHPEAYKAANLRLYEHYKSVGKDFPDTLHEMQPLFHAIRHGVAAGQVQQAFDEVYSHRILRGNEKYIVYKLGAFSADLGALAHFFDPNAEPIWAKPLNNLPSSRQALALNFAGFALRALGRLREAVTPFRGNLSMRVEQKVWRNAAVSASNLSELLLSLGDVNAAISAARKGVIYADNSQDLFQRMGKRTTLADTLHQSGDGTAAETLYIEAETLQAKRHPSMPKLYSVQGYRYCDLLLSQDQYDVVSDQAKYALNIVLNGSRNLQDIALNHLSLGRAAHLALRAQSPPLPAPLVASGERETLAQTARNYLDTAVEGLRDAGQEDSLQRGLLARAAFYRDMGEFKAAQSDLQEATEIAQRSEMRLHLTDCYLEWVRQVMAADPTLAQTQSRPAAEACFKCAADLIEATGYHRRDGELLELRKLLDGIGSYS